MTTAVQRRCATSGAARRTMPRTQRGVAAGASARCAREAGSALNHAPLSRPCPHADAGLPCLRGGGVRLPLHAQARARHRCRISSPAADWIAEHLGGGYVIKEKFLGGSNWSSAYVYTTEAGSE